MLSNQAGIAANFLGLNKQSRNSQIISLNRSIKTSLGDVLPSLSNLAWVELALARIIHDGRMI